MASLMGRRAYFRANNLTLMVIGEAQQVEAHSDGYEVCQVMKKDAQKRNGYVKSPLNVG
jgi:hypothetical protein